MPSAVRVPLPTAVTLDPHFRIDIRDPTNGAVGLRVGKFADVVAFERTYKPRPGIQERPDVLFNAQLWAAFLHAKLGEQSWRIEGLDAVRGDLTPSADPRCFSRVLHAFMPSSPMYQDLMAGLTAPTMYHTLRPLLADIIACQVVWYQKLLDGRALEFEQRSTRPGPDQKIWRLWKLACPNLNYLDALYIVSIRRFQSSGCWVYIPEVEIRSPFNF